MRVLPLLLLAMLLAGCVSTVKDVSQDPSTPRMSLHFDKDWRATYQAINAGALQCDSSVRSSEDVATTTGTVASVLMERVVYVVTVKPDPAGAGSDVTILMPMHEAKQRRTWPQLLDLWVNQNDRTTCPKDIWRG